MLRSLQGAWGWARGRAGQHLSRSRAGSGTQWLRLDKHHPQPGQTPGVPGCLLGAVAAAAGPRAALRPAHGAGWGHGAAVHGCPPAPHCSAPSTLHGGGSPSAPPAPGSSDASFSPPRGKPLGFALAAIPRWDSPCCAGSVALPPPPAVPLLRRWLLGGLQPRPRCSG